MKTLESLRPKHIAEEGKIGNTRYKISDDCVVPQEQVPEILRRIARIAQIDLTAQYIAEQRKANEEKVS